MEPQRKALVLNALAALGVFMFCILTNEASWETPFKADTPGFYSTLTRLLAVQSIFLGLRFASKYIEAKDPHQDQVVVGAEAPVYFVCVLTYIYMLGDVLRSEFVFAGVSVILLTMSYSIYAGRIYIPTVHFESPCSPRIPEKADKKQD
eukprot:TRINITY_DN13784_c0_g1_i1.p1 TRINITY_DN13784_c0_g1~~TRINITY_DN13784_c0_g1_i1.p1  ORF type:complete len:149 (-),score=11.03 TRINITY_DN13784_c0_g1_i1:3-449(-)